MPTTGASTVLIVDDDTDMLELCATVLGAQGYIVLKAIGSAEALQVCTDYPKKIDLILLDVMLYPRSVQVDSSASAPPRMHGDKLLPMLRRKRPSSRLLIMSASSPWKLGGRGMSGLLRQYSFLQKPFTGEVLLDKVRLALASEEPPKTT